MARVPVEQFALTDSRYEILAQLAGLSDADHARGKMLKVWNECQERETYSLRADTLDAIFKREGIGELLIRSALARKVRTGVFYICGTRGRVEWLKKRRQEGREGGKLGGRPRKTPTGSSSETPGGIRQAPPVKTPSASASASLKTQKEEIQTPEENRYSDALATPPGPGSLSSPPPTQTGPGPGPKTRRGTGGFKPLGGNGKSLDQAIDEAPTPTVKRRLKIEREVVREHPDWTWQQQRDEIARRFNGEQ